MSKTYEDEQAQLKEEIQILQKEIEVQGRQSENLRQFIPVSYSHLDVYKRQLYCYSQVPFNILMMILF